MKASMAVTGVPLRVHNDKLLVFTWLVSYDRCQTGPVQCESLKRATRIVGDAVRISVKLGAAITLEMAIKRPSATNMGGARLKESTLPCFDLRPATGAAFLIWARV